MSVIFGTPEWLAAFVKRLASDAKYRELSKNYESGPLILKCLADPAVHELLQNDLRFFFDAWHGEIREARILEAGEDAKAWIELEGSYKAWKLISTGKLGLKKAVLMTRQLKVRGAKVTELVKYMGLADRIMEVMAESGGDFVFPDEV